MAKMTLSYDAKVDSKKRITLRGAKYDYYSVVEMSDGTILLSPRVLVSPSALSMMDQSVEHLKAGEVSDPIKT